MSVTIRGCIQSTLPMTLLLSGLSLPICLGAEDTTPVPDRVDREIQAADTTVAKLLEQEAAKLVKQLEKDKADEAHAGRLETVLAIERMIVEVKNGKLYKDQLRKVHQLSRNKCSIPVIPVGGATKVEDGYEVHDKQAVRSEDMYSPPIDVTYIVKTDTNNIRLGFAGEQIIFGWEVERGKLVIVGGPADGQRAAGKGEIPSNQFITIRQVVTDTQMRLFVNDEDRGSYPGDFSKVHEPILIYQAFGAVLTVKDILVSRP